MKQSEVIILKKSNKNEAFYLNLDFILTIIKVLGGLLGNCKTLLADGILSTIKFIDNEIKSYYKNKEITKTKSILRITIGLIFIVMGLFIIKNLFNLVLSLPAIYTIIFATIPLAINLYLSRLKPIDIISFILVLQAVLLPNIKSISTFKYFDLYGAMIIGILVIISSLKTIKSASDSLINIVELQTRKEVGDEEDARITRSRNRKEKTK